MLSVSKLLIRRRESGSDSLLISKIGKELFIDYYLPDGSKKRLSVPKKLEKDFIGSLENLLEKSRKPDSRQYFKLDDGISSLNFFLTVIPESGNKRLMLELKNDKASNYRLNQLGMQAEEKKKFKKALTKKSGLIIISSPAKQGITSLMQAAIKELSKSEHSLYAFGKDWSSNEDGVNYSKEACLENLSRIDAEIIFIDNIADQESLKSAINLANSGRLAIISLEADSLWEVLSLINSLKSGRREKFSPLKLVISSNLATMKRQGQDGRKIIGLYEALEFDEDLHRFLINNPEQNNLGFYKRFLKIAANKGYRPLAIDRQLKEKNGLL